MNCLKFLKILENRLLMFLFSVSFLILNSQIIRAESIKNYDVEILINRNGTLTVNEKIGYKIREAQLSKVPYMLVVGDKEVEANKVSVRARKDGDIGQMDSEEFINKLVKEVEEHKN